MRSWAGYAEFREDDRRPSSVSFQAPLKGFNAHPWALSDLSERLCADTPSWALPVPTQSRLGLCNEITGCRRAHLLLLAVVLVPREAQLFHA
jgi:hypothetical protein